MTPQTDAADFDFRTIPTQDLTDAEREQAIALFQLTYREANIPYLERSFNKLRYAAFATHDGEPAGFALGESRVMDLPRLPQQFVTFAGICCVDPRFRRRGLFGALEMRTLLAGDLLPEPGRVLAVGRMAHPASMRVMQRNRGVVPRLDGPPTPWQQAVGIAIAEAYGVYKFDPLTFVSIGDGTPIGYPAMEVEATEEEWAAFRHVDRSRGDALLGLSWRPDPPPGWDDPGSESGV
jgi:hypothetical protein